jgi:hypothetical protein
MTTKNNNPPANDMRNPKANPIVIFLSAVVAAFVAGITALIFLTNQIEARTRSAIYDMKTKNELPLGPQGPPGPAGIKFRLLDPVTVTGNNARSLGLKDTEGFCYLSRVTGNLDGSNDTAQVFVDNHTWILQSTQPDISATAQCVRYTEK